MAEPRGKKLRKAETEKKDDSVDTEAGRYPVKSDAIQIELLSPRDSDKAVKPPNSKIVTISEMDNEIRAGTFLDRLLSDQDGNQEVEKPSPVPTTAITINHIKLKNKHVETGPVARHTVARGRAQQENDKKSDSDIALRRMQGFTHS